MYTTAILSWTFISCLIGVYGAAINTQDLRPSPSPTAALIHGGNKLNVFAAPQASSKVHSRKSFTVAGAAPRQQLMFAAKQRSLTTIVVGGVSESPERQSVRRRRVRDSRSTPQPLSKLRPR
jgi:hypothetical protein